MGKSSLWACVIWGVALVSQTAADEAIFLPVAAILEKRCVECHHGDEPKGGLSLQTREALMAGGDSGPAIGAGRPTGHLLLSAVQGEPPEMPKNGPKLTAEEIAAIDQWLQAGAPWPEGRTLEDRSLADSNWWSLAPLVRPDPPRTGGAFAAARHNEIDDFILARLDQAGLTPAPPADRRTLIRRLSFDLLGLPPSFAEVEAFANDPDPRAYEKLVEQMLASPRYGERWARHWLDVVHFGETHGYDKDKPRLNAWPYRDYVIRSLNEDKPYDRFVQEQLAGDVLFPDTRDGIEALGFLSAGPWDLIGHSEVPETKLDGKLARHLDRDNMVATTINTFCSLTVHCAQCHNHKFDPIRQEDYYALQAVFAALDRADRVYDLDPHVAQQRRELVAARRKASATVESLRKQASEKFGQTLKPLDEQLAALRSAATDKRVQFGWHSAISPTQDAVKWVQVDLGRSVEFTQIVLHPCSDDFNGIGDGFGFPVRFRIEAADDAQFQSGVSILADQGTADVANPGIQSSRFDTPGAARYIRVTATKLALRQNDYIFALAELEVRDAAGHNQAAGATVGYLDSIEAPPRWGGANLIDGWYPGAPADAARTTGAGIAQLEQARQLIVAAALGERHAVELVAAERQLVEIDASEAQLSPPLRVYAGTVHHGSGSFLGTGANGGRPRSIFVLARGDVKRPGREVGPGTIPLFGLDSNFELPADTPEGERRAALARWITASENALTWRSIVNRVWQHHFGRGLVDTPNDFGRMGGQPSHPELLDWLAVTFRDDQHGSLKQLHRLMVTSAAYRQAGNSDNPQADEIDAENRWLWRANRRKLEAEAIRDAVLLVSGKLDLTMGGPSFQDFSIVRPEHSPHYEYHLHDPADPKSHRRSIYRFLVRSQPQPFMTTLDCADPSLRVDKRNETLSAQQALALLNNGFMVTMSRECAERIASRASDPPKQADELFRQALSRSPSADERQMFSEFIRQYGLANACRAVFNLNEFAFVD